MAKNKSPLIGIAAVVAVLVLVIVVLVATKNQTFSGLEAFPTGDYQNAPSNLMGNRYVLEAQIDSMLEWEEGVGRLLAIRAFNESSRVPVFVPEDLNVSLHVGQRYKMAVSIIKGGLIYVEELEKF